MTEREKLIELLGTASSIAFPRGNNDFIADFLLAHGVVVPPCKVGDTVYTIYSDDDNGDFIEEPVVVEVSTHRIWIENYFFDYDDIGNTVFLTREQAEQALDWSE